MRTYKHNGIEIRFSPTSALFTAMVGDRKLEKPSLESMRRSIGEAKRQALKPFMAIVIRGYPEKAQIVRVVRAIKDWRGNISYATKDGCSIASTRVFANTPENRRAVKNHLAILKRHTAITEKMRKEASVSWEAIKAGELAY